MDSPLHPRQSAINETLAILKSLTRDVDLAYAKWQSGHLAYDSFQKLTEGFREKQLEFLRVLAELTKDPVGRWDKMMGD